MSILVRYVNFCVKKLCKNNAKIARFHWSRKSRDSCPTSSGYDAKVLNISFILYLVRWYDAKVSNIPFILYLVRWYDAKVSNIPFILYLVRWYDAKVSNLRFILYLVQWYDAKVSNLRFILYLVRWYDAKVLNISFILYLVRWYYIYRLIYRLVFLTSKFSCLESNAKEQKLFVLAYLHNVRHMKSSASGTDLIY